MNLGGGGNANFVRRASVLLPIDISLKTEHVYKWY